MKALKEFFIFLKEYKVVGLAIAFIMGVAATSLIKSLVENILMPTLTPFIPGGEWREATFGIGPFLWKIGAFIGELLNFAIIALVVFLVAKYILREETVTKK
ncbi:MAG: MscL family protein [Candidatus Pacearchaeota archaeon]